MSLRNYLKNRRAYEYIALAIFLTLIGATNATSIILENYRNGSEINWVEAFATEYTAVLSIPLLFPFIFPFLNWLNISIKNIRWRIVWHVPGFLIFASALILILNVLRKLLWSLAGQVYEVGPIFIYFLYEVRKVFWIYLLIVVGYHCYNFILNRLQGEARFLSSADDSSPKPNYADQFLVKMLDREYLVRVNEIEWINSASNYVLLKCGSRQYPMRQTLKGLIEELDPEQFVRVHRSAIVNLDYVDCLLDKGDAELNLVSGESLSVSKTYLPHLQNVLQKKLLNRKLA